MPLLLEEYMKVSGKAYDCGVWKCDDGCKNPVVAVVMLPRSKIFTYFLVEINTGIDIHLRMRLCK
jgi:hypothetical protein